MEWSPKGQQILISLGHAWVAPEEDATVVIIEPGGTIIHRSSNLGYYASWSPNGTEIATLTGYQIPDPEKKKPPHKMVRIVASQPDGSKKRILLEAKITENPD